MRALKMIGVGASALALCSAAGAVNAQPGKRTGGAAPVAHSAPQVSTPHINAVPHMSVAPHINASPSIQHSATPRISRPLFAHVPQGRHFTPNGAHIHTPHLTTHFHAPTNRIAHNHAPRLTHHVTHNNVQTHNVQTHNVQTPNQHTTHGLATTNQPNVHTANTHVANNTALSHIHSAANPTTFAKHRNLASTAAFRPFFDHDRHRHHHLGWIGPLFWPYAYGDIFYIALWPDEYAWYDPFWYYGYDDIYEGIFWPYSYVDYVQGRHASRRLATLSHSVAQTCSADAAEVTGWPIDQIKDAVQPDAQQNRLLDDLGNAVVQASDVIKSHCTTKLAFTPTDRLAQMQDRLEGMVQAVNIVQPALARFYDSLNDEQKARFDAMGEPQGQKPTPEQKSVQNPQACGENTYGFPADRIEQQLGLDDAQRTKLTDLQDAAGKAAELIKAACPGQIPATPPGRLAAEGKLLQAMLQGVQTVRPPLDDFYGSLNNEQRARFNTIGQQLFAQR